MRKVATRTTKARSTKRRRGYNYDTPMGVVAKTSGIQINVSPEMKAGDFLKSQKLDSFARILKML